MTYVISRRNRGGFGKRSRTYPYTIVTVHRPECRTLPPRAAGRLQRETSETWPVGPHIQSCKVCRPLEGSAHADR